MYTLFDRTTDLRTFPPPSHPQLIIQVAATYDAYMPKGNHMLQQHWPGSQLRLMRAGHLSSVVCILSVHTTPTRTHTTYVLKYSNPRTITCCSSIGPARSCGDSSPTHPYATQRVFYKYMHTYMIIYSSSFGRMHRMLVLLQVHVSHASTCFFVCAAAAEGLYESGDYRCHEPH